MDFGQNPLQSLIEAWYYERYQSQRPACSKQSNTAASQMQRSLTLQRSINCLWHANIFFQIKLCVHKRLTEKWGEKVKSSTEKKASGAEWFHKSRPAEYHALQYSANIHSVNISNYVHACPQKYSHHNRFSQFSLRVKDKSLALLTPELLELLMAPQWEVCLMQPCSVTNV